MKHLNLRLSEALHAELVAAARGNHRSLQKEIVARLSPPASERFVAREVRSDFKRG